MKAKRGFSNERHGRLKVGLSALALVGFGGAWFGFANSHDVASASTETTPTVTPAATPTIAQPTARSRGGRTAPTPTPAASPATPRQVQPTPVPTRARHSRGS